MYHTLDQWAFIIYEIRLQTNSKPDGWTVKHFRKLLPTSSSSTRAGVGRRRPAEPVQPAAGYCNGNTM